MNHSSSSGVSNRSYSSNTHATTAIVLRTVDFSETSLVVTLLTKDLGRVSALAKGARRLKGPFEGSLDLLSVCQIVLIAKPGDNLDLLTESKLRRRFRGGERSLSRTNAGFYIAETLRYWLDDDEPHEELFELTLAALGMIDGSGPVAETLLAYDCQCLRLLGHAPSTRRCTVCDVKLNGNRAKIAFSLEGGGVVCDSCRPSQSYLRLVNPRTIDILEGLLQDPSQPYPDEQEATGPLPLFSLLPRITETSYPELRGLVSRVMRHLLNRELRMQPYLPTDSKSPP